jgi:signal peptidase I
VKDHAHERGEVEEPSPGSIDPAMLDAHLDEPDGGTPDGTATEALKHAVSHAHGPAPSRTLRFLYWVVWFVALPLFGAIVMVWLLTPPSGVDPQGPLGFVRSFVREQPVPTTIALFTMFEMSVWSLRHKLPFSRHAHPALRPGVSEDLRESFERARGLLDEAQNILERHAAAVAGVVSEPDRDTLLSALRELERTMDAEPFDEPAFTEALLGANKEIDRRLGPWRKSEAREYAESIGIAVLIALLLRSFVFEAFKIPSGSMIPTLQVGDHIFVNKFSYGPAIPFTKARLWSSMPPDRGDVMVFAFPENKEQDFIKRVIALPGDELRTREGHPIINGWEVPSCRLGVYSYVDENARKHEGDLFVEYLNDESYLTLYDHFADGRTESEGPYYVAPGEVWVMGDNRHNSHDSRRWRGGLGAGVPYDNIRGRALFVWVNMSDKGFDASRMGAPVMGRPRLPAEMKHLEPAIERCLKDRPPVEQTQPPPPRRK